MAPRWLLVFIPLVACSSRNETAYGGCQASAACAEATPRCVLFNNRLTGRGIGLCTVACATSADCPDRGVCLNTETATLGSVCVQRCTDASECRFPSAICPNVRPAGTAPESGCVP
jgi:hypothetical protein